MKKKIAILGSTGSIGKSTLEVIKKDKKNFDVILLSAKNNYKKLVKQAKEFKAKNILIKNQNLFENRLVKYMYFTHRFSKRLCCWLPVRSHTAVSALKG